MSKSNLLIVHLVLGLMLGVGAIGFLLWDFDAFGKAPPAFKIGSMIFVGLIGLWFFMAHRTPDKEGLDYKVTR